MYQSRAYFLKKFRNSVYLTDFYVKSLARVCIKIDSNYPRQQYTGVLPESLISCWAGWTG